VAGIAGTVVVAGARGVEAVVMTVVAGVVAAGMGAGVVWAVAGAGLSGGTVHPANNTAKRRAAPRTRDHFPDTSVLIRSPHDVISSV
jgi:hypothetical protein